MARVFTTAEGEKARIGHYGEASNETPCLVPEEVARQLEAEMKGEEPNPKITGHIGRPSNARFRIERDEKTHEKKAPGAAQKE